MRILTFCVTMICVLGFCRGALAFDGWLLLWQNLFQNRPMSVSPETSLLTEPLTADGRVDYYGAYEVTLPNNLATDENGARILVRAVGLSALTREIGSDTDQTTEGQKRLFYEALGLDPALEPTLSFTDPGKDWQTWCEAKQIKSENQEDGASAQPQEVYYDSWFENWTPEKEAFIADWQRRNADSLALIRQSVAGPTFCLPVVSEKRLLFDCVPNPSLAIYHRLYRILAFDARCQIAQGRYDAAVDSLLAVYRLNRHFAKSAPDTLIFHIMEWASLNTALSVGLANHRESSPTAEQWRRLQSAQKELIEPDDFKALLGEQYVQLEFIERFPKHPDEWDEWIEWVTNSFPAQLFGVFVKDVPIFYFGLDGDRLARHVNHFYDEIRKNPKRAYRESVPTGLLPEEILFGESENVPWSIRLSRAKRSDAVAVAAIFQLADTMEGLREAYRRTWCGVHLAKIGVAMQLYRAEHDGQLPPAYSVDTNEPTQEAKDGQRAVTTPVQTTGGTRKQLHSWRVLILPYFGDEKLTALYHEIKLDEPWDSEYNRQFHERMPEVYLCPTLAAEPNTLDVALSLNDLTEDEKKDAIQFIEKTVPLAPGQTGYTVLVGEHTLFGHDGIGRDPTALSREHPGKNIAQMILVTERISPACWMCPDAEMTEADALVGIGNRVLFDTDGNFLRFDYLASDVPNSFHPSGVNALFANGASNFLSSYMNENIIQERVTGSASN